ncbi:MAG TPA: hypothetical protein VJQ79_10795 [Acidimicrobiia bacterium]|nr:hypothetical protein [Acidimicrobiia bacterium]
MFIQLATSLTPMFPTPADAAEATLSGFNSTQLADYLEQYWRVASAALRPGFAAATGVTPVDLAAMARFNRFEPPSPVVPPLPPPGPGGIVNGPESFHHLAYAFALENTKMVDIFRRVVAEFAVGERLSLGSQVTQRWAQITEELFFTHPRSYSIRGVTSDVRPNHAGARRNAYYRLLGLDLSHGLEDGTPFPYIKPDVANRDFSQLFEALLREVWLGFKNRSNFSGEDSTDDAAILELLRRLQEMLLARRLGGALSREEFDAVAMLSWFHLTLLFDTAITVDLRAQAAGAADRLRLIGQRVAIAPHARSDAFLQLAQPLSIILRAIEFGAIPTPADLYNGPYTADMLTIITQWSIATGQNIKDPTARTPVSDVVIRRMVPSANGRSRIGPVVTASA